MFKTYEFENRKLTFDREDAVKILRGEIPLYLWNTPVRVYPIAIRLEHSDGNNYWVHLFGCYRKGGHKICTSEKVHIFKKGHIIYHIEEGLPNMIDNMPKDEFCSWAKEQAPKELSVPCDWVDTKYCVNSERLKEIWEITNTPKSPIEEAYERQYRYPHQGFWSAATDERIEAAYLRNKWLVAQMEARI